MTTTKEQLLQYFRTLDVSTLEKLQKYSKLLIIPDEDLLVNATMSQMVEKAHSLADSLFPEWTDRSKSDFGEFLVELFALFSEKDFWYINAFANEGLLRKMRSYSNAFSKASSMGYQPVTCKGATCNFNVSFAAGEATRYERGDLIVDVNGIKFTNDEAFDVPKSAAESNQLLLLLHEGTHVAEDVTYNGYNILIRKANIDIDSILVTIDNVIYTQVRNFGYSSSDSTHFMVLPEEDGSCSIYFGSNGFGVQPSIGKSVRVEYRTCQGSDGNTEIALAEINDSLSDREATAASMVTAAEGGVHAETLTSIKEKTPLYFNTKRAAINETVAQDIINSFSFVHKSKVVVIGREVVYRIIPTSGYLEPTFAELATIAEEFHPYIMAGYVGAYTTNTYKNLMVAANPSATKIILDVIILSGYNADTIESSLRQIMEDITNPLVSAEYGGSFIKTDTDILMRSRVSGVQSVTFKVQVGTQEQIMSDVTLGESEIFRKINQNNLIVRTNVV